MLIHPKPIAPALPPGARILSDDSIGYRASGLSRDGLLTVNLDSSPTLYRFLTSRKRARIVLGPVGSGKTVVCCVDPLAIAMNQEPGPNKVRPFKLAIVRNSMPELWRTTIETWLGIYDESLCGRLRRSTPIRHSIFIDDLGDGTSLDFQAEFFGLDRPDQVKALLSYEATMMYFNEMREIPAAIIDAATDRVGRYPSMQKGGVMPTFAGIIGDSNPPDKDHWLYGKYENPPEGWEFFLQPPGITEVEQSRPGVYRAKPGEPPCGEVPEDMTTHTLAGKTYAVNPAAENLPNLPIDTTFDPARRPLGKGNYYLSRVSGKTQSWIDGYYRNKFTFVVSGAPVIPEFNLEQMAPDYLEVLSGVPIGGGYDIGSGTLSPAAIIGQAHPSGIYLVHAELSIDHIGMVDFGEQMKLLLEREFPDAELEEFFGDPAGGARDGLLKKSYFDHLRGYGLPVKAAPTQDPELRIDAMKAPMLRLRQGQPGILINRRRCPKLVRALSGAWHYRKMQVAGADRFALTPEKSVYSHVCDALGYWLCGKGEMKVLRHKDARGKNRPPESDRDHQYDYFGD